MMNKAIIIDSREQTPFNFGNYPIRVSVLQTGDYSLEGFTDMIAVERKSLPDFVSCCGKQRDRFKKELLRLRSYPCKAVIIEATLKQLNAGNWRGLVTPDQVLGSINSWRNKYRIEFIYGCNHDLAGQECFRLIKKYYDFTKEYIKRFNQ